MQRCVVQILHSSNVTFATLNDDSSHPKRLQKRPIFHHTGAAASSTRQHYPGHAGRVAILWCAQPCATVRTARTENTAAALVPLGLSSVNGATIVSYTKAENME